MVKADCLHYEEAKDMGATVHWCKANKEIIATCSWCDEYVYKDLVQVVRCKDCKWHEEISGWYRCLWWHNVTEPEVFCSMGERREEG